MQGYSPEAIFKALAPDKKTLSAFEMNAIIGSAVSIGNVECFIQHNHINYFDEENLAALLNLATPEEQ